MLPQQQITLRNTIPEDISAYADHSMVNTVIRNLISNALKFTPAGGNIEVSTQPYETAIEVAVSDTGMGIPQEDIPKLFRIDVQHTNVGTAGETGTGLGLILCQELVEWNKGKIWVESEVGKGTCSDLRFPGVSKCSFDSKNAAPVGLANPTGMIWICQSKPSGKK